MSLSLIFLSVFYMMVIYLDHSVIQSFRHCTLTIEAIRFNLCKVVLCVRPLDLHALYQLIWLDSVIILVSLNFLFNFISTLHFWRQITIVHFQLSHLNHFNYLQSNIVTVLFSSMLQYYKHDNIKGLQYVCQMTMYD